MAINQDSTATKAGNLTKDYASAGRIDTLASMSSMERERLGSRVRSELKLNSIRSQSTAKGSQHAHQNLEALLQTSQ